MSIVGAMIERREIPAFVRFERRAIEDRAASAREGRYIGRDVDFALVTPPYSKDCFEAVAAEWLAQMEKDSRAGRLPREFYERYTALYQRWKAGEELPIDGTPIKGWAVISPAQQQTLIGLNILTVESLAGVNDEGLRRIGMGGGELRDKAKAWLSQTSDKGPLTMENAQLKADNRALKTQVETLEARVKELAERIEIMQRGGVDYSSHVERSERPSEPISASDILEPVEQPKRAKSKTQAI